MAGLRGLMKAVCIGRGIAESGLYRFAGSRVPARREAAPL